MPAHAPAGSVPQDEITKLHPEAFRPRPPSGSRWENHILWVQRTHWQGEMRLWATVLADCVKHLRLAPKGSTLYVEALEWVQEAGTEIVGGAFKFDNVCAELDLDADWVRGDLLRRYA